MKLRGLDAHRKATTLPVWSTSDDLAGRKLSSLDLDALSITATVTHHASQVDALRGTAGTEVGEPITVDPAAALRHHDAPGSRTAAFLFRVDPERFVSAGWHVVTVDVAYTVPDSDPEQVEMYSLRLIQETL